jgi:hypothetical protein
LCEKNEDVFEVIVVDSDYTTERVNLDLNNPPMNPN